jgi:hypothetical protein
MATYTVSVSDLIPASAAMCYGIVADYREGHPLIVPPKVFGPLVVEAGGVGAGTRVRFTMTILGITRELVADITEPEPGRKLVEVIEETGAITNFLFDPTRPGETRVTIETIFPLVAGLRGAVERWVTERTLPRIYREELQRLAEVCKRRGGATR